MPVGAAPALRLRLRRGAALAAAALFALGALAASSAPAREDDAVLLADDECAALGAEGEEANSDCALNAMQLRGQRLASREAPEEVAAGDPDETEPDVEIDGEGEAMLTSFEVELALNASAGGLACRRDPVATYLGLRAPRCAQACPELCAAALPVLAGVRRRSDDALVGEVCLHQAGMECALKPENAEACRALFDEAKTHKLPLPTSLPALAEMCGHDDEEAPPAPASLLEARLVARRLAEAVAAEASEERLLDEAMVGKAKDGRCNSGNGMTCVNRYQSIVCANGYRMSVGEENCEDSVGLKSYCRKASEGHDQTQDFCDDPFCRNGGAYLGAGRYCENDHLIYCSGNNAPKIIDPCDNHYWTDSDGRDRVSVNHCVGNPPDPNCIFPSSQR